MFPSRLRKMFSFGTRASSLPVRLRPSSQLAKSKGVVSFSNAEFGSMGFGGLDAAVSPTGWAYESLQLAFLRAKTPEQTARISRLALKRGMPDFQVLSLTRINQTRIKVLGGATAVDQLTKKVHLARNWSRFTGVPTVAYSQESKTTLGKIFPEILRHERIHAAHIANISSKFMKKETGRIPESLLDIIRQRVFEFMQVARPSGQMKRVNRSVKMYRRLGIEIAPGADKHAQIQARLSFGYYDSSYSSFEGLSEIQRKTRWGPFNHQSYMESENLAWFHQGDRGFLRRAESAGLMTHGKAQRLMSEARGYDQSSLLNRSIRSPRGARRMSRSL